MFEELGAINQTQMWLMAAYILLAVAALAHTLWNRKFNASVQNRVNELLDIIELQHEGVYKSSINGRPIYANKALAQLNGYQTGEELCAAVQDLGKGWYVDRNRRTEFQHLLRKNGKITDFVSEIRAHKTGKRRWISENAWIVYDKNGHPSHYSGTVRDITHERKSRKIEERLEKLADNLPGGLFQIRKTPNGIFQTLYMSSVFRDMLCIAKDQNVANPNSLLGRIYPDDLQGYAAALLKSAKTSGSVSHDFRLVDHDKSIKWVNVTATSECLVDGSTLWNGFLTDISERKIAENKIEQLAYHDPLTDLPNRRFFMKRLDQTIGTCSRHGDRAAVIFIDLDNFKALNDNKGHEIGDELLQLVAKRLSGCVRVNDTVSRFGGDEFVILMENLEGNMDSATKRISIVAEKILGEFAKGFELSDGHHVSTPSLGISLVDGTAQSGDEIIRNADNAMYQAKKAGRNTYVLFDPDSLPAETRKDDLLSELRKAISNDELIFQYQPQVDRNGKITGSEALVRWLHPVHGMMGPAKFMPLAEKSGMMNDINNWVLQTAINTLATWHQDPEMKSLNLAVNMSVQKFSETSLVEELETMMDGLEFDREKLVIEITEQVMSRNPKQVAARMKEIKSLGFRFSLDDFGTGHSSLSQLNKFPFDQVKIDGSFVSEIENLESNRTLIEGILGMAKALQLETVAEHVSSMYQESFLRTRGCGGFQGYFYYPPLNESDFCAVVSNKCPDAETLRIVS